MADSFIDDGEIHKEIKKVMDNLSKFDEDLLREYGKID